MTFLSGYALVNMSRTGKSVSHTLRLPNSFGWYRSVFIATLLILWAYKLTLDPTKPLEDTEFMAGSISEVMPCTFEFQKRIPETELKNILQHYPDVV
jgi:hypothetical protein